MNPYAMVSSGIGTTEAASLSTRLAAWHDAMVAHERRVRSATTTDVCDDECPHVEARALWAEAVETFGPRANDLAFLRSRALTEAGQVAFRTAGRRPRSFGRSSDQPHPASAEQ
jgi:hypothetical protein